MGPVLTDKTYGREGEDKDTAGEEDLKRVTQRSCPKVRLQPSVMEEGAAGVEDCGKCSLHTGIQGRRSALMVPLCNVHHFTRAGTDFKTGISGLSNKKSFSFLFSDKT